jgi:hypothetical protein
MSFGIQTTIQVTQILNSCKEELALYSPSSTNNLQKIRQNLCKHTIRHIYCPNNKRSNGRYLDFGNDLNGKSSRIHCITGHEGAEDM